MALVVFLEMELHMMQSYNLLIYRQQEMQVNLELYLQEDMEPVEQGGIANSWILFWWISSRDPHQLVKKIIETVTFASGGEATKVGELTVGEKSNRCRYKQYSCCVMWWRHTRFYKYDGFYDNGIEREMQLILVILLIKMLMVTRAGGSSAGSWCHSWLLLRVTVTELTI